MPTLLIMNGPNLNLLGTREPEIYGSETLEEIHKSLQKAFPEVTFQTFQSNSEGALIDRLQQAKGEVAGVVFNPGAYTHTSVALHDAVTVWFLIPGLIRTRQWRFTMPSKRSNCRSLRFIFRCPRPENPSGVIHT